MATKPDWYVKCFGKDPDVRLVLRFPSRNLNGELAERYRKYIKKMMLGLTRECRGANI